MTNNLARFAQTALSIFTILTLLAPSLSAPFAYAEFGSNADRGYEGGEGNGEDADAEANAEADAEADATDAASDAADAAADAQAAFSNGDVAGAQAAADAAADAAGRASDAAGKAGTTAANQAADAASHSAAVAAAYAEAAAAGLAPATGPNKGGVNIDATNNCGCIAGNLTGEANGRSAADVHHDEANAQIATTDVIGARSLDNQNYTNEITEPEKTTNNPSLLDPTDRINSSLSVPVTMAALDPNQVAAYAAAIAGKAASTNNVADPTSNLTDTRSEAIASNRDTRTGSGVTDTRSEAIASNRDVQSAATFTFDPNTNSWVDDKGNKAGVDDFNYGTTANLEALEANARANPDKTISITQSGTVNITSPTAPTTKSSVDITNNSTVLGHVLSPVSLQDAPVTLSFGPIGKQQNAGVPVSVAGRVAVEPTSVTTVSIAPTSITNTTNIGTTAAVPDQQQSSSFTGSSNPNNANIDYQSSVITSPVGSNYKGSTVTIDNQTVTIAPATAAHMAALGIYNFTERDIQTLGKALAGELPATIVDKIAQGKELTLDEQKQIAPVVNTAVNRAVNNYNMSLYDAIMAPSQYSAFNKDYISTTNNNYNQNPAAFDKVAESFVNGSATAKSGLSVTAAAAQASHYYNPNAAAPAWAPQLTNTERFGQAPYSHIAGTLGREYQARGDVSGTVETTVAAFNAVNQAANTTSLTEANVNPTPANTVSSPSITESSQSDAATNDNHSPTAPNETSQPSNPGATPATGGSASITQGIVDAARGIVEGILGIFGFDGSGIFGGSSSGQPAPDVPGGGENRCLPYPLPCDDIDGQQAASIAIAFGSIGPSFVQLTKYISDLFKSRPDDSAAESVTVAKRAGSVLVLLTYDFRTNTLNVSRPDIEATLEDPSAYYTDQQYKLLTQLFSETPIVFADDGTVAYSNGLYSPPMIHGQPAGGNDVPVYNYVLEVIDENGQSIQPSENADAGQANLLVRALRWAFGSTAPFTFDDVKLVTYKLTDPDTDIAGDEYYTFSIELLDGSTRTTTTPHFSSVALLRTRFGQIGYTGDVTTLIGVAEEATEEAGLFGKTISMIEDTASSLFDSLLKTPSNDRVTSLPSPESGWTVSDLKFAYIYPNAIVECPDVPEYDNGYVYTVGLAKPSDPETITSITSARCGYGDINTVVSDMAEDLVQTHQVAGASYETLINKTFISQVPVYYTGQPALLTATETTSASTITAAADTTSPQSSSSSATQLPNLTNTISFEVKAAGSNGQVITNWTDAKDITISSGAQLFFRWNGSDYQQCLPFLNDNGNYSLTRKNRAMITGNTEEEGYDITERSGTYRIECGGQRNNEFGVDSREIAVTVQ